MEEETDTRLDNSQLWDGVSTAAARAARITTERADYDWSDADPITYQWDLGAGTGDNQAVYLANFGDGDIPSDDAASYIGVLRELLLLIICGYFDAVSFLDEDAKVFASYAQDRDGKWRKEQPDEC